jgi:hypothetical protein
MGHGGPASAVRAVAPFGIMPETNRRYAMKTDEMIESFRAIMALANKGLSARATAVQRAEQLRLIEAEASRSATRLLSAVVLG